MKRTLILLLSSAVVLAAPVGAVAHKGAKGHKHRAKVFKATLGPVGTDATYAGIRGKAQLVDGKKNNKITIHVRNLQPGTTYPWHIHEFAANVTNPCAEGAAQGPIVTAFTYKRLKANASGNANSKGTSRTFTADRTKKYYVNVHNPATGAPIACGVLKGKKAKKAPSKSKRKSPSSGKGKGKGRS
jgi:hypothetical protein